MFENNIKADITESIELLRFTQNKKVIVGAVQNQAEQVPSAVAGEGLKPNFPGGAVAGSPYSRLCGGI